MAGMYLEVSVAGRGEGVLEEVPSVCCIMGCHEDIQDAVLRCSSSHVSFLQLPKLQSAPPYDFCQGAVLCSFHCIMQFSCLQRHTWTVNVTCRTLLAAACLTNASQSINLT